MPVHEFLACSHSMQCTAMGAIKLQSQCKNQDRHSKVDCASELDLGSTMVS